MLRIFSTRAFAKCPLAHKNSHLRAKLTVAVYYAPSGAYLIAFAITQ
jgi:hypothetical protein